MGVAGDGLGRSGVSQAAVAAPLRLSLYLVSLDPTVGSEIQKTRPCVIVSPDDLNARLRTVIVAPLTNRRRPYPFRIDTTVRGVQGQVAVDRVRAVDRQRLVKHVGTLDAASGQRVLQTLAALFAP